MRGHHPTRWSHDMPGQPRGKSTKDTTPMDTPNTEPVDTTDTAAVVLSDRYDTEALRSLDSFDAALALVGETLGYLADASEAMGDGFALLKTDGAKATLVGKPIILMEWSFYPGDFGDEFAAIRLVAKEPNGSISKYIVNDGSTGVAKMLREYTNDTGRRGGMVVRNGFRASEYDYCEECRSATCEDPSSHKADGH